MSSFPANSSSTPAILEVRGLVKSFGGVRAVNNASFSVSEGTITGLIGPNGAGKTTMFNLISGMLAPDDGAISFRGEPIEKLPPHVIFRKGIVRTFQIPREMKKMTVLENLMLAVGNQSGEHLWKSWFLPRKVAREEQHVREQAEDVLRFLNLSHLSHEQAGNLSTGQKKLLELGRTLTAQPQLVLLDEPVAGVNPTLMNTLAEDIKRSAQERGITFIIIEHNIDLVMSLCDPIIVMANGAKLAEGAPDDVRHNQDVLEAYLGGPQN